MYRKIQELSQRQEGQPSFFYLSLMNLRFSIRSPSNPFSTLAINQQINTIPKYISFSLSPPSLSLYPHIHILSKPHKPSSHYNTTHLIHFHNIHVLKDQNTISPSQERKASTRTEDNSNHPCEQTSTESSEARITIHI